MPPFAFSASLQGYEIATVVSRQLSGTQLPSNAVKKLAKKRESRARKNAASGRKTLASKPGTRMQLFEYPSVRYWSKEINGTRTGGRKIFLLNIRADDAAMVQSGRAGGILSIPAPEVSLGLLRVGAIHG